MNTQWYIYCLLTISLSPVFAASNYFCPGNNQIISIGMTEDQVSAACGQPLSKQKSKEPATEKVPVTQLLFNQAGGPKAFYGVWEISQGNDSGNLVEVSVIDNKVVRISLDGGSVNVNSVCDNGSFRVGDPLSKVYNACGNPSSVNSTFTERAIPGVKKPETWIYQFGQYQPTLRLRFQGGKLTAIENSSQ